MKRLSSSLQDGAKVTIEETGGVFLSPILLPAKFSP